MVATTNDEKNKVIRRIVDVDKKVRPEVSTLLKGATKAFAESTDPIDLLNNLLILMFIQMPADKLKNRLNSPANRQPNAQDSLSNIVNLLGNKLQTLKETFDKVKEFPESSAAIQLKEKVGALKTFTDDLRNACGEKVEELNAVADDAKKLSDAAEEKISNKSEHPDNVKPPPQP